MQKEGVLETNASLKASFMSWPGWWGKPSVLISRMKGLKSCYKMQKWIFWDSLSNLSMLLGGNLPTMYWFSGSTTKTLALSLGAWTGDRLQVSPLGPKGGRSWGRRILSCAKRANQNDVMYDVSRCFMSKVLLTGLRSGQVTLPLQFGSLSYPFDSVLYTGSFSHLSIA